MGACPWFLRLSFTHTLFETRDSFEVELAAPGLEKSDFRIQIIGNHLVVNVKKESETQEERITVKRGFNSNKFSKRIRLPEQIDRELVKARYKKGILTIILPKLMKSEEEPGTDIPVD